MAYSRGLPQITVPLPSRREKCRFTLKPISNTVGDFIGQLHTEDRGIDRVVLRTLREYWRRLADRVHQVWCKYSRYGVNTAGMV